MSAAVRLVGAAGSVGSVTLAVLEKPDGANTIYRVHPVGVDIGVTA